ncbi:VCBS repeat-containing protein [Streptomyces sp. HUCO-GS316]|uniref:FG-GAP-like repeat-containing protein n=1 Tax=Streptomyces sp. HUCO-GS316 TaxID=2692198 RepID=UPI0013705E2A|nr:FG-GAP-like repeat-containing protein [Streptomyces sp. HUCO-GS316]MXM61973.1 VCBS repeat-containing protein [Streptomyces sp. HUCO-GS316]
MSNQRRAWRAGLAVVMAITGAVALPAAHAGAEEVARAAGKLQDDFNGDGYADLAVGAPYATVGGKAKAGYVAVLYGSASGLKTSTKRVFTQNSAGIPGTAETGDLFGGALTTADLDKDGYADLIVGAGGEDTGAGTDAGLVEVVWGGARGLSGAVSVASGEVGDRLGAQGRLAAADVDGDGATDLLTVRKQRHLAVTRGPFARDGSVVNPGQVVKDRYDSRVLDLAVGDINGDGITDVAATENDADYFDSRRIVYWYGTRQGLTPYTLVYDIDGAGLQGGENLDLGDVNADGYDDIVVGRAIDGHGSDADTYRAKGGRVTWIPGTADGPDGVKATFSQASPQVQGASEKGDRFGTDVQVGDVNGDGYEDVVAGIPGEDQGTTANVGTVVLLRGTADGLTAVWSRVVSQDSAGAIPGVSEKGDSFGQALHLGDHNADGRADLAVGGPGENAGSGSVWSFLSGGHVVTGGSTIVFGNSLLGTVASNARLGSGFAY